MYRYTFFFQMYEQGWSETFYRGNQFGPSEANVLENYILNRLQLLSTQCSLRAIRSSNVDTPRDITITPIPLAGRGGSWVYGGDGSTPGAPTEPEDSFTALLLRLSDSNQHYRTFPLIGVPDHIYGGGVIIPSEQALVNARLNGWIQAISQAGFGMKLQQAPAVSGRITEFVPKEPDNQLVCLGLKGPIPAVGDLVTLGSVKPWNRLNRTWRVASTAPSTVVGTDGYIYLAKTLSLNSYGPVQGGKYKVPIYNVAVLNQYTISRLTSRRTGVPFMTVRGRRSSKAL